MDVLMPLAASVVCREGGLSPEASIAMTAAAFLIEGPLALAPAIVAVETQRSSGGVPPAQGDIGPALVRVPNVVDKLEEEATKELAGAKLRWRVHYNQATDQLSVGHVLRQSPATSADRVPENTMVELNVAKEQTDTIDDDKQVTEAELEASLGRVQTAVDTRLDAMEQKLDQALALLKGNP
ncbi:MAG: PASTA domain-containing protein [Inquilinus sp.]|uniref:PASTA domain-containing protein n=1 Tax=Inquilinus sp. TaxID=1932117 RepID=UPI003F364050